MHISYTRLPISSFKLCVDHAKGLNKFDILKWCTVNFQEGFWADKADRGPSETEWRLGRWKGASPWRDWKNSFWNWKDL